VRSDIKGANVRGRILCYPYGKGSTTASAWFLETVRNGNAPAALVTEGVDLSAVIGSVMAGLVYGRIIPVLGGVSTGRLANLPMNSVLTVDGKTGDVIVKV
jgi:predicted aconitase with swiveling domain